MLMIPTIEVIEAKVANEILMIDQLRSHYTCLYCISCLSFSCFELESNLYIFHSEYDAIICNSFVAASYKT